MIDSLSTVRNLQLHRIGTTFPQVIAFLDIPDHEVALCGYLDDYGLEHDHTGSQIIVRGKDDEPVLTATFDDRKRLTSLEVRLEAQADGHDEDAAPGSRPQVSRPDSSKPSEERPPDHAQSQGWDEGQLRRMMGG